MTRLTGSLQRNWPSLTVPRFALKCLSLKGKKQEKPLPWTLVCPSVCEVFLSCDGSFLEDSSYHFNLLRRPLIWHFCLLLHWLYPVDLCCFNFNWRSTGTQTPLPFLPSLNVAWRQFKAGTSCNRITFILHVLCNEVRAAWLHIFSY